MIELNEEEKEMLRRALFNQRLHSLERMQELENDLIGNYINRMSQECDDIKLINKLLFKLELTDEYKKGK